MRSNLSTVSIVITEEDAAGRTATTFETTLAGFEYPAEAEAYARRVVKAVRTIKLLTQEAK